MKIEGGGKKNCTKQNRQNTRLTKQKLNPIKRQCRLPWRAAKESEFQQRMLLPPVRKTSIPERLKEGCSHCCHREHRTERQIRCYFRLCRQTLLPSPSKTLTVRQLTPSSTYSQLQETSPGHRWEICSRLPFSICRWKDHCTYLQVTILVSKGLRWTESMQPN